MKETKIDDKTTSKSLPLNILDFTKHKLWQQCSCEDCKKYRKIQSAVACLKDEIWYNSVVIEHLTTQQLAELYAIINKVFER